MAKFRRRPNNSGTVVKLSGNRRKPYAAKITLDERNPVNGEKKRLVIGTFETREEALNALSLYSLTRSKKITNEEATEVAPDLYTLLQRKTQKKTPTFADIFYILFNEDFSNLSVSRQKSMKSAFGHLECLHDIPITDIDLSLMQSVFNDDQSKHGIQRDMKTVCTKIFKYAVIHKCIGRNDDYTEFIKISKYEESSKHYPFTIDEIRELKRLNTKETRLILVYIYTGLRASELLKIDRNSIHIDVKSNDDGQDMTISYMITGSKTDAGKNRIVPINDDIKDIVIEDILVDGERTVDCVYNNLTNRIMPKINTMLGSNHTMHDTRVTFASLCQLYNVDVYIRKKVLGHKLNDITFDVYTNESKNRLCSEINKIHV